MIRTLYLDDESDLLERVKVYLDRTGDFEITTASSVSEAEQAMASTPFDVVVSGYMVEEEDGLLFFKRLQQTGRGIPFILFTRPGRDDAIIEAYDLGASFTIQKAGDTHYQLRELEQKIRWAVERSESKKDLVASEERLHSLIDNSPIAIGIVREGRIFYVNPAYLKLLGFTSSEELVGTMVVDRIDPAYVHLMRERTERQRQGQEITPTYESVMVRKDGSRVPVLVGTTYTVRDGARFTVVFLTDLTIRKKAENALKEREETLEVALDAASLGVWKQNIREKTLELDPRAKVHLGIGDGPVTLDNWMAHIHPGDRAMLLEQMSKAAVGGSNREKHTVEHRVVDDDGSVRWLSVNARVFFGGPDRAPVMVYGTTEDITERKRTEEQFKAGREELELFFHTSLDLLLISDAEGNFRQFNPEWESTLGYSREEISQHKFYDFIHPDDMEATNAAVRDLEAQKEVLSFTNRYRCKDGSYRWIEWRSHPVGNIIYAAARDITARKKAEERLKESKEDLDLAQTVSKTGSWRIDIHTNELRWSDETYRIFGVPVGTPMTLQSFVDHIHPDDRNYVMREWNAALTGKPYDIEHRIVVGNEVKWVREKTILESMGGVLKSGFGTVQDITELKTAQEALQRSEQMLKVVLDQFPGVVFWKDRNLVYLGANRESARIAGFDDPSEYIGKTDYDLPWGKTEAEAFREDDRQVMESGQPRLHIVERQQRTGGEVAWLDTNKVPLRDSEGNIMGILGTSTDITERKHAEDALRQANKQLNLLSSVTRHDMLNQLMALSGFAELLGRSELSPAQANYLKKMQTSIRVLSSQLDFTKTYQEIGMHDPKWQNLHALIEESKHNLALGGLRVEERGTNVWIMADPMLEKVVYNLIDNVLRHGGGAKLLIVTATVRDGRLTVVFEDNGRGILEEDKKHLFERGYGKNTGFGLFVSREILNITNISIRETSSPGKGARFEIEVPQETMYRFQAQ